MSSRFFSRNKKYAMAFDKKSEKVSLLSISRNQNTPELVKQFKLPVEEYSPNKFHREKQLCKHVLGYLIKEKKMTMRELNEYAIKNKLITPTELVMDTLTTKVNQENEN